MEDVKGAETIEQLALRVAREIYGEPHTDDVKFLTHCLADLAKQQEPIGEMREEGVVWFGKNPHAFPVGTRYYTSPAIPQHAIPAALEQEPLRGDEPAGPQAARADYVRGWNACRDAMLSADHVPPTYTSVKGAEN